MMSREGIAIMLAWPKTPAIQVGSWYEGLMKLLGFNRNGYYIAGHSAIVLIDPETGELNYFDFGRYHAPANHGRVRDKITDPDLNVNIKARFNSNGSISNLNKVLKTLAANNNSFHGKGKMYAAINYKINFEKAYVFAKQLQNRGAVLYGPFKSNGTNCSRFTSSVFRYGSLSLLEKLRLLVTFSLTPTPLGNVLVVASENKFYEVENQILVEKKLSFNKQLKNWVIPKIMINKKEKHAHVEVTGSKQKLVNV